jgi:SAM-dependent methyltransferase
VSLVTAVAAPAPSRAGRDLRPILPKLRCRACRAPVEAHGDGWRCTAGHAFAAGLADAPSSSSSRRPLGERIFNHARVYRAKMALLGLLNPLPKDALDPWTAGREVLDLGCGPFQYLYDPEAPALRVGVDRSAEAMAIADGLYPRSIHLVASIDQPLPFADKSFDAALLLFVLHHLPPAVVPGLLAEAARVAREHILVFDHVRSDVPWQREVQQAYWDTFDGGDLYRSRGEWDELWRGWRVAEARRLGRMFGNVCFYRLAL